MALYTYVMYLTIIPVTFNGDQSCPFTNTAGSIWVYSLYIFPKVRLQVKGLLYHIQVSRYILINWFPFIHLANIYWTPMVCQALNVCTKCCFLAQALCSLMDLQNSVRMYCCDTFWIFLHVVVAGGISEFSFLWFPGILHIFPPMRLAICI